VLSYRVILDVPLPLVVFVSDLLAHRREIGTRNGTRALTCWKQAVFALAWFRDRPDIRRLGQGSGISQATAYRYKDEAVEVLAAKAPTLREALENAAEQGLPYLILDGTLISSDRCADKKTSGRARPGEETARRRTRHQYENRQRAAALPGRTRLRADVPAVARHPAHQPQPDHDRRHRQSRTRSNAIRAQDDQLIVAEKNLNQLGQLS
jgi:hypothetical protein